MTLPRDKVGHFIVGCLICFFASQLWTREVGLVLAIGAGVAKEIRDKATGKGTPEILDAVATISGGFLVYLLVG